MLLCSTVYDTLTDIVRKDKRGNSLNIEEFNRVAKVVNERIYAKFVENFEESTDDIDNLATFKVMDLSIPIAPATGIGTLPSTYYRIVGKPYYLSGSTRVWIDLVTNLEHASREDDYLTRATTTHPTCRIGASGAHSSTSVIYVTPTTITPIYLDYLRVADTPYLDYYMNNTFFTYTYMDANVNVTVPTGCTSRSGILGPATIASTTKNMEWTESDLPLILSLFIEILGIQLPDNELLQYGNLEEQKIG